MEDCKKNMEASLERTRSRYKYKVFIYKGSIQGKENNNSYNLHDYTLVKTPLWLFYIPFLLIRVLRPVKGINSDVTMSWKEPKCSMKLRGAAVDNSFCSSLQRSPSSLHGQWSLASLSHWAVSRMCTCILAAATSTRTHTWTNTHSMRPAD